MNCEDVRELAGAYALDALPLDERREVEAHLADCDSHGEYASFIAAARALDSAWPEREPSPELRQRLLAALDADAEPAGVVIERRSTRWWASARPAYALAASLAALVIGLAAWNVVLVAGSDGDDVLVAQLTGGATGRIVYLPGERVMYLTVDDLPPLTPEQTFQAWAIRDGSPASVGTFEGSPAGVALVMTADLDEGDRVAVTIEPAGGSPQPTTDPIAIVEL